MEVASGEKEKCPQCSGGGWVIMWPNNVAAVCPVCSDNKTFAQVEKERGVKIAKDQYGRWMEMTIQ